MEPKADERVRLTFDEALAMLPADEEIHTFRQAGFALIGADWDRDEILKLIREKGCELSGEIASRMGHGIVLFDGDGTLFVETLEGAQLGYDRIAMGC